MPSLADNRARDGQKFGGNPSTSQKKGGYNLSSARTPDPVTPGTFDITRNPVYLRAKAQHLRRKGDALSRARRSRNTALLRFGDPELAKVYGVDEDAVRGNPASALSGITKRYDKQRQGINRSANRGNLFYSTSRANDLAGAIRERQTQEQGARGDVQSVLGNIADKEIYEQRSADDALEAIIQQVASRFITNELSRL